MTYPRSRRRMPRKLVKTISDQLDRAWNEGKAAHAAGLPAAHRYRPGCDCARMWEGGYKHAADAAFRMP